MFPPYVLLLAGVDENVIKVECLEANFRFFFFFFFFFLGFGLKFNDALRAAPPQQGDLNRDKNDHNKGCDGRWV